MGRSSKTKSERKPVVAHSKVFLRNREELGIGRVVKVTSNNWCEVSWDEIGNGKARYHSVHELENCDAKC